MNAVTHGLTAKAIVIGDEDPEEFERRLAGLEADYRPKGSIEQALVERLAGALWRLARVALFEAAVIRHELQDLEERDQRSAWQELERRAEFEELRREEHERRRREWAEFPTEQLEVIERIVRLQAGFPPTADDDQEIPPEEKAHEASPEEARRRRMDTALTWVIDHNRIGNLSRYEATLMKVVTATITLLHLLQRSRMEAERGPSVIESVAISARSKV